MHEIGTLEYFQHSINKYKIASLIFDKSWWRVPLRLVGQIGSGEAWLLPIDFDRECGKSYELHT